MNAKKAAVEKNIRKLTKLVASYVEKKLIGSITLKATQVCIVGDAPEGVSDTEYIEECVDEHLAKLTMTPAPDCALPEEK